MLYALDGVYNIPVADIKTKPTDVKVEAFLDLVEPDWKRGEAFTLLHLMEKVTGEKGVMWGPSIVGFGKYHYKYESGHEGDMCIAGFSPRKAALVVYLLRGFDEEKELLDKLGKYKSSVACLYIKRLSDIDITILEKLIKLSIENMKKIYH
jgi:hypothetical protein